MAAYTTEALVKKDDNNVKTALSLHVGTCFHCGKTGSKKVIEMENKHYSAKATECKNCSLHIDHITKKDGSSKEPIHPSYGENIMTHIKNYVTERPHLQHVSSNRNIKGLEGTGREETRTIPHPDEPKAHLTRYINIVDRHKLGDTRSPEEKDAAFMGDVHKIKADMSQLHRLGNIVRTNRFAAKDIDVRESIKRFYLKTLNESKPDKSR